MKHIVTGVLCAAMLAIGSDQVRGETISYNYAGTIMYTMDGPGNLIAGPFANGAAFTGRLTYDLAAIDTSSSEVSGRYFSSLNEFTFTSGGQTIRGVPDHNGSPVGAYVSNFSRAETFGVTAHDVSLPDGWSIDHSSISDAYGVFFQNAPSRGVLGSDDLPTSLSLSDWVNTRQMRLDFWGDITWPTGSFSGRMTVFGSVNSLTRVSPNAVPEPSCLAAFLGMGVVGLVGVARRRRNRSM